MGRGGGEPTSTDELAAPFASPPGDGIFLPSPYMTPLLQPPPRYVESPLSAYLKVVDYVLKKPFSDETLRVLLDATEDDHWRVSVVLPSFVGPELVKAGRGDG